MLLKIGLQAYSVKDKMAQDLKGTLRAVADAGYRNIEFANGKAATDTGIGFDITASELKFFLQAIDLNAASSNISPGIDSSEAVDDYRRIDYDKIFKYHDEIGNRNLCAAVAVFKNEDDLLQKCNMFNEIGKICKESGFNFLYHNHYELGRHFNGRTVWDIMIENTDPEYFNYELDTYWALRGGLDPVKMLRRDGKRIKMIHIKDLPEDHSGTVNIFDSVDENTITSFEAFHKPIQPGDFIEIGRGIIDNQSIIEAADKYADCEYVFVEQDYSSIDKLDSIRISFDFVKDLKYVKP